MIDQNAQRINNFKMIFFLMKNLLRKWLKDLNIEVQLLFNYFNQQ